MIGFGVAGMAIFTVWHDNIALRIAIYGIVQSASVAGTIPLALSRGSGGRTAGGWVLAGRLQGAWTANFLLGYGRAGQLLFGVMNEHFRKIRLGFRLTPARRALNERPKSGYT